MKRIILSFCLLLACSIKANSSKLQDFLSQSKTKANYDKLTVEQKKSFDMLWAKIESLCEETNRSFDQLTKDQQEGISILQNLFGSDVNVNLQLSLTASKSGDVAQK